MREWGLPLWKIPRYVKKDELEVWDMTIHCISMGQHLDISDTCKAGIHKGPASAYVSARTGSFEAQHCFKTVSHIPTSSLTSSTLQSVRQVSSPFSEITAFHFSILKILENVHRAYLSGTFESSLKSGAVQSSTGPEATMWFCEASPTCKLPGLVAMAE